MNAIFVFADDLGVFASVRDAELSYEDWMEPLVKAVFDQHGNVFRLTAFGPGGSGVGIRPAEPPVNRWDEFVELLRYRLLGDAEARPELLSGQWVENASGEELVTWCVEHRLERSLVRRRQEPQTRTPQREPASNDRRLPFGGLVSIISMPLWLPLLVLSGFKTWLLPSELWACYSLFRRGRCMWPRQLAKHSRERRGTIIFDWASPDLGFVQVWWTEDDVTSLSPVSPPAGERFGEAHEPFTWHDFDRWVWEHYLHPLHGKAFLVIAGGGCYDPESTRARYSGCQLICSFSGGSISEALEKAWAATDRNEQRQP